jgi:hypothetical protein
MRATTEDESSPPERNAPSGTSATSRDHGLPQKGAETLLGFVLVSDTSVAERDAPVGRRASISVSVATMSAREEASDLSVEGARSRRAAVGQK